MFARGKPTDWDLLKINISTCHICTRPFDAHQVIPYFTYAVGILFITGVCFLHFSKAGDSFILSKCHFVLAAFCGGYKGKYTLKQQMLL